MDAKAETNALVKPAKKHLLWLDMAKGLAICTVVLGHCMSDTTGLHDIVYSFHMPLFFMLAGFTMRPKPRKTVLVSSFRRLIIPYIIVCCIMLFFAVVPPNSINPNLDSQRSLSVVMVEALYASGQEGDIAGHTFQAIGAIWFLPCLFWGRLILNEVLLRTKNLDNWKKLAQPALVLAITALGFVIGKQQRLPFDIDTALVAVLFMYVGYAAKTLNISKAKDWVWLLLIAVWVFYDLAGNNEMAIRAYLENPWSMVTASAGSLVIMKLCMEVEKLGHWLPNKSGSALASKVVESPLEPAGPAAGDMQLPAENISSEAAKSAPLLARALSFASKGIARLNKGFAWMGVSSLTILCVHRVESAIFNWQKIMETFAPNVWDWQVAYQGLYMFALRYALVLVVSIVVVIANRAVRAAWARKKASKTPVL